MPGPDDITNGNHPLSSALDRKEDGVERSGMHFSIRRSRTGLITQLLYLFGVLMILCSFGVICSGPQRHPVDGFMTVGGIDPFKHLEFSLLRSRLDGEG